MANLWKWATRQRLFWPPDWTFVIVIVLSIILAAWPLADPQWKNKAEYLAIVIAMLIVGSLLSAKDRWVLESRHTQRYAVMVTELRARVLTLASDIAGLVRLQREAAENNTSPPDIAAEYRAYHIRVLTTLLELDNHNILAPDSLRTVIDSGVSTIGDVRSVAEHLIAMDKELGNLYTRVLLGD